MAGPTFTFELAPGYRLHDVLAFHRRDTEAVAEQVSETRLRKGVMLGGVPVLLDVAFEGLAVDRSGSASLPGRATCTVHALSLIHI